MGDFVLFILNYLYQSKLCLYGLVSACNLLFVLSLYIPPEERYDTESDTDNSSTLGKLHVSSFLSMSRKQGCQNFCHQ